MKKETKRSLVIWGCGILAEVLYALAIYGVHVLFDMMIDGMFYFVTSSLILSVCLYLDKFSPQIKATGNIKKEDTEENTETDGEGA